MCCVSLSLERSNAKRAALAIVAAIGVGADEKKWFSGTKEEVRRAVRGTLHCTRIEVEWIRRCRREKNSRRLCDKENEF
jgi:hypothetical protein